MRKGFTTKILKDNKTQFCETIYSKFTISKIKWIYFSVYRTPFYGEFIILFEELSVCVSFSTHGNIIVIIGDFNIDVNKGEAPINYMFFAKHSI